MLRMLRMVREQPGTIWYLRLKHQDSNPT
jgi:hypothetical protein